MTSPEELDRLAKVALEAYWDGHSCAVQWDELLPGESKSWRAAVSAVLEAQGPLSLASLIDQHGAAAVCELAKEFADARVFGPWEPDLSDPPRMVRKLVGDTSWQPSRVNYISWGDGEWCTHPGWYWWATVGAGAMESNAAGKPLYSLEAAQSACDAALRAAGAVLVDQPKESQS